MSVQSLCAIFWHQSRPQENVTSKSGRSELMGLNRSPFHLSLSHFVRPKTWDSICRDHLTHYTLAFRHMSDGWPFSATTSDWTSSISVSRDLFICMMACYTPKANKSTSDTSKMSIMYYSRQWEMFAVCHLHSWKGNLGSKWWNGGKRWHLHIGSHPLIIAQVTYFCRKCHIQKAYKYIYILCLDIYWSWLVTMLKCTCCCDG